MDLGAAQQAAHVPHGLLGRVGHLHARHSAGLGQRAAKRRAGQLQRLRHQLHRPLRRPDLRAVDGLREGTPHPDAEQRPGDSRTGVPRGRGGLGQQMARRQESHLRTRVHPGLAAGIAPEGAADGGHQALGRTLHQRRRREELPQSHRHRRTDAPHPLQGRRPVGPADQGRGPRLHGYRRHAGRRPAQQLLVHDPPHDRTADLLGQRPRGQQRHPHAAGHRHRRTDGGFREAPHPSNTTSPRTTAAPSGSTTRWRCTRT